MAVEREYYSTEKVLAWHRCQDGVDGYAVRHGDGSVSWCPDEVFYAKYQPIDRLSFGHALAAMRDRCRVARREWEDENQWIRLVASDQETPIQEVGNVSVTVVAVYADGTTGVRNSTIKMMLSWIGMNTEDGKFVPWAGGHADLLADDWFILPESP